MSESTLKGAIAESFIAAHAIELGVFVLRPTIEGRRYDLLFDIDHRLFRVQCKYASRKGSVLVVNLTSCRYTPHGYVCTKYGAEEIDAFAAYSPELKRSFWLPIESVGGMRAVHLRLSPAANNQEVAIRYADDYDFDGAIAQLGERRAGSAKAGGSSPPSSTS